jgi:hypothetical protein
MSENVIGLEKSHSGMLEGERLSASCETRVFMVLPIMALISLDITGGSREGGGQEGLLNHLTAMMSSTPVAGKKKFGKITGRQSSVLRDKC